MPTGSLNQFPLTTAERSSWGRAAVVVVLACVAQAFGWQSLLSTRDSCSFLSESCWASFISSIGGEFEQLGESVLAANVPFLPLFIRWSALLGVSAVFACIICLISRRRINNVIPNWLDRGSRWWFLVAGWELIRLGLFLAKATTLQVFVASCGFYFVAISLAGWAATFFGCLAREQTINANSNSSVSETQHEQQQRKSDSRVTKTVWLAATCYVVTFTWMNWGLYDNLLIPHGDSAMYEEHIWNLLHGKGFRSYLDQGLFLGEHIQFVHVFLAPLHAIWPSHLMMELAESLALASGAFPVFWMAKRWSRSDKCASCLAVAYLCYPALQFLDIAVDLKTFRPTSFGIPAMLFALDQFERGRFKTMSICFFFALSAKEDYALMMGPFGLWIALQTWLPTRWRVDRLELLQSKRLGLRFGTLFGIGLAVFSVGYVLLTTRVLIPWFRDGAEVHYTQYFPQFGNSMGEVVKNMLLKPSLMWNELVTIRSASFLAALFVPLGCLAFLSPTRLLVAVPNLVLLCVNQLIQNEPQPWHHFHAPIIPILFWAAAGGLALFASQSYHHAADGSDNDDEPKLAHYAFFARLRRWFPSRVESVGAFCVSASFFCGLFMAMSPASIKFWDDGSAAYWQTLYLKNERAKQFERVMAQIPIDARVASTDFVHTRFTHHERSYDYSHYRRRVANYEHRVPDDTDFIVIDCRHKYSDIKTPEELREFHDKENWELIADQTGGYYIILKRRR